MILSQQAQAFVALSRNCEAQAVCGLFYRDIWKPETVCLTLFVTAQTSPKYPTYQKQPIQNKMKYRGSYHDIKIFVLPYGLLKY